ncbi:CHAD domain-containing protein [Thalassovita taeanensis]|uniref:CHAD domain-containing protein n=1 Tax=Thalassovita taeanensis TaxID=657014 RepID=A0A1H9ALP6_9RHOB|nr:CHAD domain-containing protein [Thalassovita taeanensis]SEP77684.1 CHAD domain-containing protein [Thalassovita taeanensis]
MTYRLTHKDRNLQAALRRIAAEQIDTALSEIAQTDADPDETVHSLRKRCKKLRGLLRLTRAGLSEFKAEDTAIRDLARLLAQRRDRAVLGATHAALSDQAAATAPTHSPFPDSLREGFQALRGRSQNWKLRGDDAEILHKGLAHTAAHADRAFRAARKSPDTTTMHEWRKWAKYQWYHARLLQAIWPGPLRARRDQSKQLELALGEYHDLAVYRQKLSGKDAAKLDKRAHHRQAQIETQVFALGRRFSADPSTALADRWVAWWQIWRSEA